MNDDERRVPNEEPATEDHDPRGRLRVVDPRVPPHDLQAEESLLGAMLLNPGATDAAVLVGVGPADFYKPAHGHIFAAITALRLRDEPADPVTVADELRRQGVIEQIGSPAVLLQMQASTPATSSAPRYAAIVQRCAQARRVALAANELYQTAMRGDLENAYAALDAAEAEISAVPQSRSGLQRLVGAGEFLATDEAEDEPIHGQGDQALHSPGEATFVIAVTGAGKSTYAQNYVLRRIGLLGPPEFVGLPVRPVADDECVLYVAADRPRQIRRSLARMVSSNHHDELDRRLKVWKGSLPFLLNTEPMRLLKFLEQLESRLGMRIREVILDSLKDVALELAKDEGGSAVALAIGQLISDEREVMVLHHERKNERVAKKAPATIDDVYGSTFLTACAGNVIYLYGTAGAHVVTLHHLKQSADEVGPLAIVHDHVAGTMTCEKGRDMLVILRGQPKGLAAKEAAAYMWGSKEDDRNAHERAKTQLRKLVAAGFAKEIPGSNTRPAAWVAVDGRLEDWPN